MLHGVHNTTSCHAILWPFQTETPEPSSSSTANSHFKPQQSKLRGSNPRLIACPDHKGPHFGGGTPRSGSGSEGCVSSSAAPAEVPPAVRAVHEVAAAGFLDRHLARGAPRRLRPHGYRELPPYPCPTPEPPGVVLFPREGGHNPPSSPTPVGTSEALLSSVVRL